jgi:hypothetical protein
MFYKKNRFWILFLFVILVFTLFHYFIGNVFSLKEGQTSFTDDDYKHLTGTLETFYKKETASEEYTTLKELVKIRSNVKDIKPSDTGFTITFTDGQVFTANVVVNGKTSEMKVKQIAQKGQSQPVQKGQSQAVQKDRDSEQDDPYDSNDLPKMNKYGKYTDAYVLDNPDDPNSNGHYDPTICNDIPDSYFTVGGTPDPDDPHDNGIGCYGTPFSRDNLWEVYTKKSANALDPKIPRGADHKVINAETLCMEEYPGNIKGNYMAVHAPKGNEKKGEEICSWYAFPPDAPRSSKADDPQLHCTKPDDYKTNVPGSGKFISQEHTNGVCLWVPKTENGKLAKEKLTLSEEWANAQKGEE